MTERFTSVILPVKNGERLLKQALESVLAQTRPPAEIIVVDGNSTDNSVAILSAYPQVRRLLQGGHRL